MPYPDRLTCGFCTHKINDHNGEVGCTVCDCMATQGEANSSVHHPKNPAPVHYPKPDKSMAIIEIKNPTPADPRFEPNLDDLKKMWFARPFANVPERIEYELGWDQFLAKNFGIPMRRYATFVKDIEVSDIKRGMKIRAINHGDVIMEGTVSSVERGKISLGARGHVWIGPAGWKFQEVS